MSPLPVHLTENVKEKRAYIKVEGLVVQKELGQETQVLTVQFMVLSIHLKDGQDSLPIDLLARRLAHKAMGTMVPGISAQKPKFKEKILLSQSRLKRLCKIHCNQPVGLFQSHVLQTVLADEQSGLLPILLRVRAEVPRVDLIVAKANLVNELDLVHGAIQTNLSHSHTIPGKHLPNLRFPPSFSPL